MATNATQLSPKAQRQAYYLRQAIEASRQHVAQLLHVLHSLVHLAESQYNRSTNAKQDLDELFKMNKDEAELTLRRKSTLLVVLLGFLGVYGLDYLLVRAAADWLISMGFYRLNPIVNNFLLLLVPALFIAVEVAISEHTIEARNDILVTRKRGNWLFWLAISLALSIVMPALGVATYLVKVNLTLHGQPLSTAHQIQLLGLCCLSLVAHVCMVFGGELARDARAFLWFSIRNARLQSRLKLGERAYRRARESVSRAYRNYLDNLEEHNRSNPDNLVAPGPFEKAVVKLVNELYENAIQQPASQPTVPPYAQSYQPPIAPEPPPVVPTAEAPSSVWPAQPAFAQTSSNGQHRADDDYLRRILESQIRNSEGEVSA